MGKRWCTRLSEWSCEDCRVLQSGMNTCFVVTLIFSKYIVYFVFREHKISLMLGACRSLQDKDLASSSRWCPGRTRCTSTTGATSSSRVAKARAHDARAAPLHRSVRPRLRRRWRCARSTRTPSTCTTTTTTTTTAPSSSIQSQSRSRLRSASARTAVSVRPASLLPVARLISILGQEVIFFNPFFEATSTFSPITVNSLTSSAVNYCGFLLSYYRLSKLDFKLPPSLSS